MLLLLLLQCCHGWWCYWCCGACSCVAVGVVASGVAAAASGVMSLRGLLVYVWSLLVVGCCCWLPVGGWLLAGAGGSFLLIVMCTSIRRVETMVWHLRPVCVWARVCPFFERYVSGGTSCSQANDKSIVFGTGANFAFQIMGG